MTPHPSQLLTVLLLLTGALGGAGCAGANARRLPLRESTALPESVSGPMALALDEKHGLVLMREAGRNCHPPTNGPSPTRSMRLAWRMDST